MMNLCVVLAFYPDNSQLCVFTTFNKTTRNGEDVWISNGNQRSNPTLASNPKALHESLNLCELQVPLQKNRLGSDKLYGF